MAESRVIQIAAMYTAVLTASWSAYGQVSAPVTVPDLTQPAYAQEKTSVVDRSRPEYDEIGYRYGPYIFKPSISVAQTFDSNILGSSTFERSDYITTIKPAFGVESDWATDAASLYGEGDVLQYSRYSSENVGNMTVRGDGRLDIDRGQTLSIEGNYQILHEDRYSPESQAAVAFAGGGTYAKYPTEYSLTTGRLNYVYSPSRLGFEIQLAVNKYQYSNEPTLNGGLAINSDRSRAEFTVTPRLSYELVPGYQAFVEVSGNRREYDTTFDTSPEHLKRSSLGYASALGSQVNLGDLITGEIYLGYQNQEYDDTRLASNSGVYLGASVLWNITELTSLRFTASRSIQETILTGSSGFWDTELNASVEYELLRNIVVTAGAGYSINDYEGISRDDRTVSGTVGARWKFTQIYSAGISAQLQHRYSDQVNGDFSRAVIGVDFKAAF